MRYVEYVPLPHGRLMEHALPVFESRMELAGLQDSGADVLVKGSVPLEFFAGYGAGIQNPHDLLNFLRHDANGLCQVRVALI